MLVGILDPLSRWMVPLLFLVILLAGAWRRIKVYEAFVSGAKEGFTIAIQLIPYLVAMLVALGIFRESGAMDLVMGAIRPVTNLMGIPSEILPLAIMRPLSGSGALGVATELINTFGPDSMIGRLASTMQGTTDTTFFVLTIYFGAVGVQRYRYSLFTGLLADVTSFLASVYFCNLWFGAA
ncbi:spore maturation protein [Heliophilum fasciatum]|uniref:Spore maturation protein B n=1 Tax=Heliophilum fasciatum TaxID=35700 RepID=A0A4R2RLH8_9FIRM|nr:spore maturation protein [Heliophilum fasciatum]MCW2278322.1 spore maturation protein B [Heliophilum fasciatum]TCP63804.1 spore maturation protein B [Heliophilum fasciatum]